ncbi:hypothetical protein GAY28_00260 [Azospirillum brasilense]|nr:hypothetical protein [Azospirillum brasilense]
MCIGVQFRPVKIWWIKGGSAPIGAQCGRQSTNLDLVGSAAPEQEEIFAPARMDPASLGQGNSELRKSQPQLRRRNWSRIIIR